MRRFKWIEWNLDKIDAHGLSQRDVEGAFDDVLDSDQRRDGSFEMIARTPSGRLIRIVWRFDRHADETPDVFGNVPDPAIFVITAY